MIIMSCKIVVKFIWFIHTYHELEFKTVQFKKITQGLKKIVYTCIKEVAHSNIHVAACMLLR